MNSILNGKSPLEPMIRDRAGSRSEPETAGKKGDRKNSRTRRWTG